jgi:hypothetical protein
LLSRSWRTLGAAFVLSTEDVDQAYAHARDSAQTALTLDANLSEAHNALGWVHVTPDFDLPAAEAEFRRAAILAPRDPRPDLRRQWPVLRWIRRRHGGLQGQGMPVAGRFERLGQRKRPPRWFVLGTEIVSNVDGGQLRAAVFDQSRTSLNPALA